MRSKHLYCHIVHHKLESSLLWAHLYIYTTYIPVTTREKLTMLCDTKNFPQTSKSPKSLPIRFTPTKNPIEKYKLLQLLQRIQKPTKNTSLYWSFQPKLAHALFRVLVLTSFLREIPTDSAQLGAVHISSQKHHVFDAIPAIG